MMLTHELICLLLTNVLLFFILFLYCTFYSHSTCIVVSVDPRGCVFHLNEWEIQPFAS